MVENDGIRSGEAYAPTVLPVTGEVPAPLAILFLHLGGSVGVPLTQRYWTGSTLLKYVWLAL